MNYNQIAHDLYDKIGGKENLISAAHCATRLRLVIADNDRCKKDEIEQMEGVKGVFFAAGQLQIIFGTGVVNKVYEEFIQVANITGATKEEVKQAASAKTNWFQRAIKTLGDIFVPIIPAIVASGFLLGIMEALSFMVNNGFIQLDTSNSLFVFAQLFSNVAYVFLPILIAFSAANVFGTNPYLGAVIGMIMIHPNLQNAWTVATEGVLQQQEVFFGLYEIDLIGYQGHVIPIIIAVWVLSVIEKKLHKIVPSMIDLFVTPLVSIFVTGYITLSIIGPVFVWIENGALELIQALLSIPLGIGGFLVGGIYATTVVSGIHHMYTTIDIGQLAMFGFTFWLPIASAANVAQGGAALAIALKSKDKKVKSLAFPASLSAFLGITEPAIFGVNLKYVRPFITGSIGAACGALYASLIHLGATGTGVTGIFGVLLHLHRPVHYIITIAIAAGVSFVLTWLFGYKEERVETVCQQEETTSLIETKENEIYNPIEGTIIPLNQVKDKTFAAGILGNGAAIVPEVGRVIAPFYGQVATVFDTKHAIGLVSDAGIEVLIHIGINTVELEGKYFTVHVKDGDNIVPGQVLVEFDQEQIKQAGYDMTTPIVVTNSDQYETMTSLKEGKAKELEAILSLC